MDLAKPRLAPSPRQRLPLMEVPAGRSIVRQRSQRGAGLAAFAQFHRRLLATHVGLHPAGVRGVDLDVGVAQFIGKVHGEGVERGLRCVVGERLGVVDGRVRIGVQSERSKNAGEVDDAAGGALLDAAAVARWSGPPAQRSWSRRPCGAGQPEPLKRSVRGQCRGTFLRRFLRYSRECRGGRIWS